MNVVEWMAIQNPNFKLCENTGKLYNLNPEKISEELQNGVSVRMCSKKLRIRKFVSGNVLEKLKSGSLEYRVLLRFFDKMSPDITIEVSTKNVQEILESRVS